ncbi:uncharacterized protein LOC134039659 isoform X2 [Osmerus eperlanus]|uniref:uncharacterized protein LOC134039659 isoform X2 n=1 Tax=Osmerus eperlanus TaxID=29151 RepID=UPI002E0E3E0C
MWHLGDNQRYRQDEQTPQVIDHSEVIDGDQFLTFANEDEESFEHTPYSTYQIQRLSSKPEAQVGTAIAERPPAAQPGKRQRLLHSGKLPSPAELMGRRKRGRTAGALPGRCHVPQPRVAAVLQHIGDLHRRQGSIDRLKRERWWGKAGLPSHAEGPEDSDSPGAEAPQGPTMSFSEDKTEDGATVSVIPEHTTFRPESLFGGFEEAPHLAPGGNPMMSFVLATADRQAKGAWQSPRLSHKEFWGIEHHAEEE